MQIINVRNLNFSYKKNPQPYDFSLINTSFDIDESRIFSILGPNGSGKSTLLKIISKIYKNFYGEIKVLGNNINNYTFKQYAKLVHFIPQNQLSNFDFSVIDTIVTGINANLNFFDFPAKNDYLKAEQLLEKFKLIHLKDKSLKNISGGENQLVFFLRALISGAKILIFDEPTAFLDFKNQFIVLEAIKEISNQGKTIIISLHDPNHVSKISDKVMLLKNGQPFKIGEPRQVLNEENLSYLYDLKVKMINHSNSELFFKI